MHRIVVALLAALDALIVAAVGVAFVLAPLTLFWATTGAAPWGSLWPMTAEIWQLGHLIPLHITLPEALMTATGVSHDAATFVISLAPLAFAGFAIVSGARSGVRAAKAGGWLTGVVSGVVVFTGLAALIHVTSRNPAAWTTGWQSVLFPALLYGIPMLIGSLVIAWRDGDGSLVDWVHDRLDEGSVAWSEIPALAARGLGIILAGFVALGAVGVLISILLHGSDVIALYQSARVDLWGAVLLTLAHLAYLPTLIVWSFAWIAGPGFSVGAGAQISPVGSEPGILPALPVFGLLPTGGSVWMLAVVLLPIAVAVTAGWVLRSSYVSVLGDREPLAPRAVLVGILTVGSAGATAIAAVLASGAIGPGRLAELGPDALMLGLIVGAEVLVGSAIMLLSPRRADEEWAVYDDGDDHVLAEAASPTRSPRSAPKKLDDTAEPAVPSAGEPADAASPEKTSKPTPAREGVIRADPPLSAPLD